MYRLQAGLKGHQNRELTEDTLEEIYYSESKFVYSKSTEIQIIMLALEKWAALGSFLDRTYLDSSFIEFSDILWIACRENNWNTNYNYGFQWPSVSS